MGRFTPVPDLNVKVAVMVADDVRDIAERVGNEARRLAPGTKRWVAVMDQATRDTHRGANGQEVPENLRFKVKGQPWDEHHGLSPGIDWLLRPRDTSGGLPLDSVQHVNCRCVAVLNPAALASKVRVGPTQIVGNAQVKIAVYCEAYQVVQAEFGDTYPTRLGMKREPGTRFMGRAAAHVARAGI